LRSGVSFDVALGQSTQTTKAALTYKGDQMLEDQSTGAHDSVVGTKDEADSVREFGYKPVLHRSMGRFSVFAISFSLISISTGIFANYGFGLNEG
jgi:hypothetical protein